MEDKLDLSSYGEGDIDLRSIQTRLPFLPITSAKREDGNLEVTVLTFHGIDASEEECFPPVSFYE